MTIPIENKRILFLDDSSDRHELFTLNIAREGLTIVHVWTVDQAIVALQESKFEEVFLDHDLNDYSGPPGYGGKPTEITGTELAKWMADVNNLPLDKRPDAVTIHSWNIDGSRRMGYTLHEAGFKHILRHEFGSDLKERL